MIRFTNEEVVCDADNVLDVVKTTINDRYKR